MGAIVALDVKKVEGLVAGWWKARIDAELRSDDLAASDNLVARRAGPWRTVTVNAIVSVDVGNPQMCVLGKARRIEVDTYLGRKMN